MQKFMGFFDLHWGKEPRGGRLVSLHDERALDAALSFAHDFKPDHITLGGDMLDCGPVSHHRKNRLGELEGMRIVKDAEGLRAAVIKPLEKLAGGKLTYHVGNHEHWLDDMTSENPALEGLLDLRNLLNLSDRWNVVQQGDASKLGKLYTIHGDQVRGGANPTKWAADVYGRNIMFGHFHTHAATTRVSPLDTHAHTATSIPCLCTREANYGKGSPNRWLQGFAYGYLQNNGNFNLNVVSMVNSRFIVGGKMYGR